MAIGQGNKIIASEINESASTSFSQGAAIKATDIAELYGGTDTIATGKLILAEHFQNLGLTGSGGLNGEFYTSSKSYKLKEAVDAGIISYTHDSSGWQLTFPVGGTLNFSNFGKWGSAIDVFILGGGGAGNKNGGNGGGGGRSTGKNINLSTNTKYSLVVGAGGTTNGASGGHSSASFYLASNSIYIVAGGEGGKAGEKYAETWYAESNTAGDFDYVRDINATSWSNSGITKGNIVIAWPQEDIDLPNIPGTIGWGLAGYLGNDKIYWYKNQVLYADNRKLVNELYKKGSDGSGWSHTLIFDSGSIVGGVGSALTHASRPGQGGGGNTDKAYGGTFVGQGANGLIAIRNHRS